MSLFRYLNFLGNSITELSSVSCPLRSLNELSPKVTWKKLLCLRLSTASLYSFDNSGVPYWWISFIMEPLIPFSPSSEHFQQWYTCLERLTDKLYFLASPCPYLSIHLGHGYSSSYDSVNSCLDSPKKESNIDFILCTSWGIIIWFFCKYTKNIDMNRYL